MKKVFVVILGLLFSNAAFAQLANMNMNGVPARSSSYEGIDGSPYLYDEYVYADFSTFRGELKEKVSMRFNIHENEMETINDKGTRIILDKKEIKSFVMERPNTQMKDGMLSRLVFKKGFEHVQGIKKNEFVNVLGEGAGYTLIRKFYSDLVTPMANSYAPTPGKSFVFEEKLYLVHESGEVSKVRLTSKGIQKGLDKADRGGAKKIVKDENLDLSKETHIPIFFSKLQGKN